MASYIQHTTTMKECAFCTNPAVDKGGEHLWSDWMNKLLSRDPYTITQFDEKGVQRKWMRRKLDLKAPVVCEKCNSGWMSRLENDRAKPAMKDIILSDRLAPLSLDRMKSIASFAFKSAVIADHMSLPNRDPFFPVAARHTFAASLDIPINFMVWLAAFKEVRHGVFRAVYHPCPANAVRRFELYVFTFGAGFLIFQTLAVRWLDSDIGKRAVTKQAAIWNKFSIPILPNDGQAVLWPPNKQFDLRWASTFSHRWQHLSIPGHWF
jgi:hypothetical protein